LTLPGPFFDAPDHAGAGEPAGEAGLSKLTMVRDSLWGGTAWIRRGCGFNLRYVGSARNSPETGETRGGARFRVQIGCDAILAPIALAT
jgi:hypothetical protein